MKASMARWALFTLSRWRSSLLPLSSSPFKLLESLSESLPSLCQSPASSGPSDSPQLLADEQQCSKSTSLLDLSPSVLLERVNLGVQSTTTCSASEFISRVEEFDTPSKSSISRSSKSFFSNAGQSFTRASRIHQFESLLGDASVGSGFFTGIGRFCLDGVCSRALGRGHKVRLYRGFSSTKIQEVEQKCWLCESKSAGRPFFVCTSCQAIQPLDQEMDFFQLLSLERSFEVDVKELEKRYKGLQKFLHPDLSSLKSEREQRYSADQSAQVIKAYYTLLEPLSRAQYLLKLNGINTDEEGTIHNPELLMESGLSTFFVAFYTHYQGLKTVQLVTAMHDENYDLALTDLIYLKYLEHAVKKPSMWPLFPPFIPSLLVPYVILELREEVEEANEPKKLEQIKENNKKKMQDCEKALKAVFSGGDLASAVPVVQRMTYYDKINEEITRKQ